MTRERPPWWPQDGEEPDPRWSLANERTQLAYLRTSLAFVVSGLAIAGSYSAFDAPAWLAMLGLPLIVLGTVIGATSHGRFVAAQQAMRRGEPLPPPMISRYIPWTVAAVGAISVIVATLQLVIGT
jgi:putative membrane protein